MGIHIYHKGRIRIKLLQAYHTGSHSCIGRGRSQGGVQIDPSILWHALSGQVVTHLGVIGKTHRHISGIGSWKINHITQKS